MSEEPEVGIDLDDTLRDWRGALLRKMGTVGILLSGDDWTKPDLFETTRELYGEDAVREMFRIVEEPNFHLELPLLPGAATAIIEMLELGIEGRIITWPWAKHKTCASENLEFIRQHFGHDWETRTIITSRKADVRVRLLIDDKPGAATFDKYPPTWRHVMFDGSPVSLSKFALHPPEHRLSSWMNWRQVIEPLLAK